MKIVYLVDEDLHTSKGVADKIRAQISVWVAEGHDVALVGMRPAACISPEDGQFAKFARHFKNCLAALEPIRKFAPDVIYSRYIKYAPLFARSLVRIAPYVVEINTNDVTEFGLKNRWHGLYNRLTRGHFLRRASGFVCVTNQLATDRIFAKFGVTTHVIGNGYPFPEHFDPPARGLSERPRLLFVGSPNMPWHGMDKVVQMALGLPEYDFHIVGPSADEFNVRDARLPNLIWHGRLEKCAVDRLMDSSDVGISTLALHRNGMDEACPLKSRHYLSHGLPIIVGYRDPDLEGFGAWVLQIPNAEDSVSASLALIKRFVERSHQCDRHALFESARRRLDSRVKEKYRLRFLASVVSGGFSRNSSRQRPY